MASPALPPQDTETEDRTEEEELRARYEQALADIGAGRYFAITKDTTLEEFQEHTRKVTRRSS